jgi:VanZ family protein
MRPLRYPYVWLGLGIFMVLSILALALLPNVPGLPFSNGDKYLHAFAFASLTLWFSGLVEDRRSGALALALLAYGILIEWLQHFTTYRMAEVGDVAADAIGIALGLSLAFAGLRAWCARVESWIRPDATA